MPIQLACHAQWIDSLPFHVQKGLIAIAGTINNKPAELIMDTGAGVTVTHSALNEQAGIKVRKRQQVARDANREKMALSQTRLDEVSVGKARQKQVAGVTYEMPYLTCLNLALLGQDFMYDFHWRIHFDKRMVYVSQEPFSKSEGDEQWTVRYNSKRPFVPIVLGDTSLWCLIDLGYRGYLDLNLNWTQVGALVEQKMEGGFSNERTTMVMGLLSTRTISGVKEFNIDRLGVGGHDYPLVPANAGKYEDAKIGWMFLERYFHSVTFNHAAGTVFLERRKEPLACIQPLNAGFLVEDGRLLVSDMNESLQSSAAGLKLGDEVAAVDGKTAAQFSDQCGMLAWRLQFQAPALKVTKTDGSQLMLLRQGMGCR